jgi:hypothetical protein
VAASKVGRAARPESAGFERIWQAHQKILSGDTMTDEHSHPGQESMFAEVARTVGETVGSIAAKVNNVTAPVIADVEKRVKAARKSKAPERAAKAVKKAAKRAAGKVKKAVDTTASKAKKAAKNARSAAKAAAKKASKKAKPRVKAVKRKLKAKVKGKSKRK